MIPQPPIQGKPYSLTFHLTHIISRHNLSEAGHSSVCAPVRHLPNPGPAHSLTFPLFLCAMSVEWWELAAERAAMLSDQIRQLPARPALRAPRALSVAANGVTLPGHWHLRPPPYLVRQPWPLLLASNDDSCSGPCQGPQDGRRDGAATQTKESTKTHINMTNCMASFRFAW